jgi:Na+/serine symporter
VLLAFVWGVLAALAACGAAGIAGIKGEVGLDICITVNLER